MSEIKFNIQKSRKVAVEELAKKAKQIDTQAFDFFNLFKKKLKSKLNSHITDDVYKVIHRVNKNRFCNYTYKSHFKFFDPKDKMKYGHPLQRCDIYSSGFWSNKIKICSIQSSIIFLIEEFFGMKYDHYYESYDENYEFEDLDKFDIKIYHEKYEEECLSILQNLKPKENILVVTDY